MFRGLDSVGAGVGARVVYRFNDGFRICIDHIWGLHQMLDVFELDGWRRSVLTGLRKHRMTGGSIHSSAVDQVVLKGSLGRVWGDASKTKECFSIMFIFSGAESVKVLDPAKVACAHTIIYLRD